MASVAVKQLKDGRFGIILGDPGTGELNAVDTVNGVTYASEKAAERALARRLEGRSSGFARVGQGRDK